MARNLIDMSGDDGGVVAFLGLRKFFENLNILDKMPRGKAGAEILRAGAEAFKEQLKISIRSTFKNVSDSPGSLSNSIEIRVVNQFRVDIGYFGHPYAEVHEYGAEIAGWVKFQKEGEDEKTVRGVTIPARPFFRPTVDSQTTTAAVMAAMIAETETQLGITVGKMTT